MGLYLVFLPAAATAEERGAFQMEHDNTALFLNDRTMENQERAMNMHIRSKPNARKMRYRPLENDARVDPLDEGFENWLRSLRTEQLNPRDIDEDYENFVRDISALLFTLGEKELPAESKELLERIPADSLASIEEEFVPKNTVSIERGREHVDPFPDIKEDEIDETVGADVGLNISVRQPDIHTSKLMEMGYDALLSGQIEGAISIYKNVVNKEPDNKQALFGLATSYHRSGQLSEARKVYIDLLSLDQNNWPAMNNFLALSAEEAPEDALKELRRLESENPEFSPIPAQIAMVYMKMGRLDESIKYLGRALVLSPDNVAYRYNLAVIMDHAGYKPQAARLYQQLMEAADRGVQLPESKNKIRERLAFIVSSSKPGIN